MHKVVFPALIAVLSVSLAGQAQALNARTWVSATGTDQAGCGPIASPCRTLQFAHDQTNGGGEIDVKDSAGYGSVVISKSISIVSDGALGGVLGAPGGNAIEINAPSSATVVLRGLTVEGSGTAYNGIVFNSGSALDISNCTIQNFQSGGGLTTGNGILIQPTSGVPRISVTDTNASNNAFVGLYYLSPANSTAAPRISFDRVTTNNNQYGLAINNYSGSGLVRAAVTNSTAANNNYNGFFAANVTATFDNVRAEQNQSSGLLLNGTITVGRSISVNNATYGLSTSGTVMSYKDNRFEGNGTAPTSGTIVPATLQ